jgi:hypothetical protein
MSLDTKHQALPPIPQNMLVWEAVQWRPGEPMTNGLRHWYAGPIEPGMIFAWRPDVAHARKLVIMADADALPSLDAPVDDTLPLVDVMPIPSDDTEFRLAVVPTTYHPVTLR